MTREHHGDESDQTALVRITARLRRIGKNRWVDIGRTPQVALSFWPDRVTNRAVITSKGRQHYMTAHQEIETFELAIIATVRDPDEVHRYERDPRVANLYRSLTDTHDVMVSLWISDDPALKNSVLSARISRHRAKRSGRNRGLLIWERSDGPD